MHSSNQLPPSHQISSLIYIVTSVFVSAAALALVSWSSVLFWKNGDREGKKGRKWQKGASDRRPHGVVQAVDGIVGCVGNTPLIRIKSLSEATGCDILGKAEFLNPGGSVKDRVALQILDEVRIQTAKHIIR